jgi:hypothetical protein
MIKSGVTTINWPSGYSWNRQFMVVTPLLIIFQLYPGSQFMVVTLLSIIFQLYPDGQFSQDIAEILLKVR